MRIFSATIFDEIAYFPLPSLGQVDESTYISESQNSCGKVTHLERWMKYSIFPCIDSMLGGTNSVDSGVNSSSFTSFGRFVDAELLSKGSPPLQSE